MKEVEQLARKPQKIQKMIYQWLKKSQGKECYLYEKFDFKGAILNQKKEREKKKNIDDCKQLRNFFELSLS